jgi:hypothetical protein
MSAARCSFPSLVSLGQTGPPAPLRRGFFFGHEYLPLMIGCEGTEQRVMVQPKTNHF